MLLSAYSFSIFAPLTEIITGSRSHDEHNSSILSKRFWKRGSPFNHAFEEIPKKKK
tara:strand:+ start:414 stop:581 length:168 start_codon:yes stop_codon:yes gene_type:complete